MAEVATLRAVRSFLPPGPGAATNTRLSYATYLNILRLTAGQAAAGDQQPIKPSLLPPLATPIERIRANPSLISNRYQLSSFPSE
jgi:hypothetical protein